MANTQRRLIFKVKKNPQNFYGCGKEGIENFKDGDIPYFAESAVINYKNEDNHSGRARKRCNDIQDGESVNESGSPPKIEKCSQESLSCTPSHLMTKLNIHSPKHIPVADERKHFSPKNLFDADPLFQQARQALHSCPSNSLPGREEHMSRVQTFLFEHLEHNKSGTMYISGPPGTGKTACLTKVMQLNKVQEGFKMVYVNCTTMKTPHTIYSRICSELNINELTKTVKARINSIETALSSKGKMILLVLDEIDQLDSRNQTVLYTIFEWPSKPNSRVVLIGIANALDLTDRILPRLQARIDLKPTLIHFPPYTKQEIVAILSERLKEFNVNHMFGPATLQLLAAKVSSISGDVRRALDIGRRVLEIAESRHGVEPLPLQPINDNASNSNSPRKSPRKISNSVDLKVVMEVLNSVYGTSQSLNDQNDAFPIQQKVLLCTLLLMLKSGPKKDITLAKLHEVYRKVCKRRNLSAVDWAEFRSLCQMIEIRGIIRLQGNRKEARLTKISLQWDEEEVASVLKDKQLLALILSDTSCLSQ